MGATSTGPSLGELAREFREAVQQVAAILSRLQTLAAALEREAVEEGSSGALCPYDEIVSEWNSRCAARGMAKRNTPGVLKPAMLRLWRKHPNLDLWRAAFDACARNSWWTGSGGWRGTLESFLRPGHSDRFFDEALGAAPQEAGDGPHAAGSAAASGASSSIDQEIDALLRDPTRPLPTGYAGRDPRATVDTTEKGRRVEALREWMENDWRFGS